MFLHLSFKLLRFILFKKSSQTSSFNCFYFVILYLTVKVFFLKKLKTERELVRMKLKREREGGLVNKEIC